MAYFVRALIAVVVVVLAYAVIPAVGSLLQFTITGPLWIIIRAVIVVVALWYIFWGPPIPPRR